VYSRRHRSTGCSGRLARVAASCPVDNGHVHAWAARRPQLRLAHIPRRVGTGGQRITPDDTQPERGDRGGKRDRPRPIEAREASRIGLPAHTAAHVVPERQNDADNERAIRAVRPEETTRRVQRRAASAEQPRRSHSVHQRRDHDGATNPRVRGHGRELEAHERSEPISPEDLIRGSTTSEYEARYYGHAPGDLNHVLEDHVW
jgi:hypothetical protein